jgi:hypothetical protein
MDLLPATDRLPRGWRKVVVHDLAKSQRKVAQNVHGRDNLKDWQLGDWCHDMRDDLQGKIGTKSAARSRPDRL